MLKHVAAAEPTCLDGGLDPDEPLLDLPLETVVDRSLLLPAVRRAAEDEGVFAAVRGSHALDLDPLAHPRPVLFEKLCLYLAQERTRGADEVEPSRSPKRFEVPFARHPPVEDPDPRGLPIQRLHLRHHPVQRRGLGLVPREDLVPQRQPALRHYQPDHHLHAVRSVVAAVTPPRLGVAFPQTLEVRARQVVEQDVEGLVEQSPNPRLQMRLERRLVRQQLIQSPVEPVLVHLLLGHPADVLESRLRVKALLNRKLRRGCDQPCRGQDERHHWPRNLLPAPLHALLEQLVETQKPP